MIKTYAARRMVKIGTEWREPGLPVPEGHTWRLVESLVRAGNLAELELSEADFADAVTKFCPDLADQIYTALKLEPVQQPGSRKGGRPRQSRTVLTAPPTPIKDPPTPVKDPPAPVVEEKP